MGVDKIFSGEMNSTMPKNHKQGYPNELAKVMCHNGPTNLGTSLNTTQSGSTTKELWT
jgi:hypothetical protein